MTRLPTCFSFLGDDSNTAVDSALIEAFPQFEPELQREAIRILLERGELSSQVQLISRFNELEESSRKVLAGSALKLSPAIRRAIGGSSRATREAAVDLVIATGATPLAFLLAEALAVRDRGVQAKAAGGLLSMVRRLERGTAQGDDSGGVVVDRIVVDHHLRQAVSTAVESWDGHRQSDVLGLIFRLADRVAPVIQQKLSMSRSKFSADVNRVLPDVKNRAHANFVVQALAHGTLTSSAAVNISTVTDTDYALALLDACFLLSNPAVRRGCRQVRRLDWLTEKFDIASLLTGRRALAAVELLRACGLPEKRKYEVLRLWLTAGGEELVEAVIWVLIADSSESSTRLLKSYALRGGSPLGGPIKRELSRRSLSMHGYSSLQVIPTVAAGSPVGGRGSAAAVPRPADFASGTGVLPDSAQRPVVPVPATVEEAIARAWEAFDDLDVDSRNRIAALLAEDRAPLVKFLAKRIRSSDPAERMRAMNMAQETDTISEFKEPIYLLARDQDEMVRSRAVALLAQIETPVSTRILRDSAIDPDLRVQANAIEAMDQLDLPCREDVTRDKLASPDNRVRANAIRSLLRTELESAGEALLSMLEDDSAFHRMSALWVVDRLKIGALIHRVGDLAKQDEDVRVRRRAGRIWHALHDEFGPAHKVDMPETPS